MSMTLEYAPAEALLDDLNDHEAAQESAEMVVYFEEMYLLADSLQGEARRRALAQLVVEAMGDHPLTGEPYYHADDVALWLWGAELSGHRAIVSADVLVGIYQRTTIPVAVFVEAFTPLQDRARAIGAAVEDSTMGGEEEPGLSAGELGEFVGITRTSRATGEVIGDSTVVQRTLGLRRRQEDSLALFTSYDRAVRFADALGLSYPDAGV